MKIKDEKEELKMWKNFKVGLIAMQLVLLYLIVVNLDRVFGGVGNFLGVIAPFIMGAVIAFLLNKSICGLQRFFEKSKSDFLAKKASTLAVVSVFLLFILLIILVFSVAVPIIVGSISVFVVQLPDYYEQFLAWVNGMTSDHFLFNLLPSSDGDVMDFVSPQLVANIGSGVAGFASGMISMTANIFNIFIALIVALYILLSKESIKAFVKRLMCLFMGVATYEKIASYADKSNQIFSKFIGAQFLDACILGTIATIILVLLGVPHAITFGLLLGVCNMIPIFGSIFATAVTTVVTIFTGGTGLALVTLIALLILQQIDANFIGPKITGEALGLKPLVIIFAIIVGGAYFGVVGMFVAVPIAAMSKMFLEDFMVAREKKLKKVSAVMSE